MTDQAKLRLENPFWNKKLDRAIRVRDTDKDGVITRKDFELVAQRYKDLAMLVENNCNAYRSPS